jgi:hypothetical protein
LTLKPPFKGLSANTINSLTKRFLQEHGIPTEVWGAHSTRGAGVKLWKGLGLLAEEVCEIGQWKNLQAFQAHYLRLGAVEKAASVAQTLVHKTSLPRSAEPDGSSTPRRRADEGGKDPEGEAQKGSEPTHPPRKRRKTPDPGNPKEKKAKHPADPPSPPPPERTATTSPRRFTFKPTVSETPTPAPQAVRNTPGAPQPQ